MFKVNDYIVYGTTGVCQITDIRKDDYINNNDTQYYVLNPIYSSNDMTIMIPVNNQNTLMRSIITKDEVLSLIAEIPEQETVWIDNDRERNSKFKNALKSGNNEDLLKIIKTLHLEKEARSAVGRKLNKADEDIMNTAEKQIYEEFAIVLNISPDEVVSYIREHIQQNNDSIN